jgi:hypothetical protein
MAVFKEGNHQSGRFAFCSDKAFSRVLAREAAQRHLHFCTSAAARPAITDRLYTPSNPASTM